MSLGYPWVRAGAALALLSACSGRDVSPSIAPAAAPVGVLPPGTGTIEATRTIRPSSLDTAEVTLPARADLAARVRDRETGMAVAFTLVGARAIAATPSPSGVVYRRAGPGKSDVIHRPNPAGMEDFLAFDAKPGVEAVRYRVDVSAAAGLRLVGNVLELLDAQGAPRLRMAAPYLTDRGGARHDATVALEDCAADRDPSGPWGRALTPKGRDECSVRVSWGGSSVEYPALLDPSWASTKSAMTTPRTGHTATLLANKQVLVVGGSSPGTPLVPLKSAELFDPASDTFAATGSMTLARSFHSAVRLKSGDVLVAGGTGSGLAPTSELYSAGGGFRSVGALRTARREAGAALLEDGRVLIAGGRDLSDATLDSAELFDPTGEQWTATASMASRRTGHYLTALPGGTAMVIGGLATAISDLGGCEFFEPASGRWVATAGMSASRQYFAGATFAGGRVLVASGYQSTQGGPIAGSEIFDFGTAKWSSAGDLAVGRALHTLTALGGGAAVATGGTVQQGSTTTATLKSAELYDPVSNAWRALPDLQEARSSHTATLLDDGRVLLAGGDGVGGPLATAELLSLDANGIACSSGATCSSGFCADGVCCESKCTTTCNSCSLATTGKPDGACAPTLAGKDPHGACKDDGTPACGQDGFCDGSGVCEHYPGSSCTPSACAADADCTSGHCADGICCDSACSGKCEACTTAKKGSSPDGICGPVAAKTDPDTDCPTAGAGVCLADGYCDGARACTLPTAGTPCASATCTEASATSGLTTLVAAAQCDAAGGCTGKKTDCSPYRCDSNTVSCRTTCATDAECTSGAHCVSGACQKSATGQPCKADLECASGACADLYCCDKACTDQCAACDLPGKEGTCTAVTGKPRGSRAACSGTGDCSGSCNGLLRTGCVYPRAETTCGPGVSCTDGTEAGDHCNGSGECVSTPTHPCAPFGCGVDACNTRCTTADDCSAGSLCDKTGLCVAAGSLSCSGAAMVLLPDGGASSCGAYLCSFGRCTTSCKTDADCAAQATCSKAGECSAPASADGGGCGCRLSSPAPARGTAGLAALLALGALGSRRRRPGSLLSRRRQRHARLPSG
jgi:hypothetical protein